MIFGMHRNNKQIEALNVPSNSTRRFDCLFCGHHNSLVVSRVGASIRWICFYAGCKASGRRTTELGLEDLRYPALHSSAPDRAVWVPPSHFCSVLSSDACLHYLKRYDVLDTKGLYDVKYDPKQNRCVFILPGKTSSDTIAIGRSLDAYTRPKWLRYYSGDSPWHLVCRSSELCILSEDVISSIRLRNLGFGSVGLLGTKLLAMHVGAASTYASCILCLDKDASRVALKMQKELSLYVPTKIRLLEEDIKDMPKDKIYELLR